MRKEDDGLLIPAALLILLTVMIGFVPIPSDPDLWFHLADGRYILSHGRVPDADPFSFTRADQLWVPHSWLFDVVITLSWEHLGPRATEGAMSLVFMLTIMVSFAMLTDRGIQPLKAAALCVGLAIAAGNTRGVRPQVFTLLLANLTIFLLVRHRYRPRAWSLLLSIPLIFLLWAQLHSACVIGPILMAIWLAGRSIEAAWTRSLKSHKGELADLAGALALSVPAVLVSPHRINHFQYVALTMKMHELKRTAEWQAPRLLSLEIPDIYIYLLIAGMVFLLCRRARSIVQMGWAESGLCGILVLLALTGIRHIPLACIASVPLLANLLSPQSQFAVGNVPRPARSLPFVAVISLALLAGLWRYPTDIHSRYAREEPIQGARRLANLGVPLRVFTTYNTGSYVLWAAPLQLRVFVDSRADVYGDELLADAYRAMKGQDWQPLFDRWQVDAAVLERHDPLARILADQHDWRLLAEEASTLTFIRSVLLLPARAQGG